MTSVNIQLKFTGNLLTICHEYICSVLSSCIPTPYGLFKAKILIVCNGFSTFHYNVLNGNY